MHFKMSALVCGNEQFCILTDAVLKILPDLQGAETAGPLALLYSPEGSWPLSLHPVTPPGGLPQAAVPLSTVDVGDAGSLQAGSDLG